MALGPSWRNPCRVHQWHQELSFHLRPSCCTCASVDAMRPQPGFDSELRAADSRGPVYAFREVGHLAIFPGYCVILTVDLPACRFYACKGILTGINGQGQADCRRGYELLAGASVRGLARGNCSGCSDLQRCFRPGPRDAVSAWFLVWTRQTIKTTLGGPQRRIPDRARCKSPGRWCTSRAFVVPCTLSEINAGGVCGEAIGRLVCREGFICR